MLLAAPGTATKYNIDATITEAALDTRLARVVTAAADLDGIALDDLNSSRLFEVSGIVRSIIHWCALECADELLVPIGGGWTDRPSTYFCLP